jgi:hypothetical protein
MAKEGYLEQCPLAQRMGKLAGQPLAVRHWVAGLQLSSAQRIVPAPHVTEGPQVASLAAHVPSPHKYDEAPVQGAEQLAESIAQAPLRHL